MVARADRYDAIAHSYQAALARREAGDPVGAWGEVNQLVDQVVAQTPDPEAHRWLAVLGHRLGSLLIYFGAAWQAVCLPGADGDGCRAWVRCGRHAFGLQHLWESQRQCERAGLRRAQFPCEKARGLAQVALRKLRQQRCAVPARVELWP